MHTPVEVDVKYLHPVWSECSLSYSTHGSAGLDLRACIDQDYLTFAPGERHAVPSGVALEIKTPDIAGFVFSRSGLGTKEGLVVSQGVGVIDPDYRGEIIVSLLNTSNTHRTVNRGQRIAQLLFMSAFQAQVQVVSELTPTARGDGGFGHTGR